MSTRWQIHNCSFILPLVVKTETFKWHKTEEKKWNTRKNYNKIYLKANYSSGKISQIINTFQRRQRRDEVQQANKTNEKTVRRSENDVKTGNFKARQELWLLRGDTKYFFHWPRQNWRMNPGKKRQEFLQWQTPAFISSTVVSQL